MKFETDKKTYKKRCKPFLLLPLFPNEETLFNMPTKNTGLKLFTKTWQPKKESKEDQKRPLTATLEKPAILDIRFIGKIDMSMVRKEFLNITNLCKMPLIIKKRNVKTKKTNRPLSLPSPVKQKKKKVENHCEESWEDEESISVRSATKTKTKHNNIKNIGIKSNKKNAGTVKSSISDANNNKTFKILRHGAVNGGKLLNLTNGIKASIKLPEPCKTCGRPDQPERFHSHPTTPALRPIKKMEEPTKIPVKSTVQKPIAMKYKSKASGGKKPTPIPKSALPVQTLTHTPPPTTRTTIANSKSPEPRDRSAKRTLTCYICGREFGTASLPLHEPKCLQKWELENSNLPPHLRRKPPTKPDPSVTQEEWNQMAWESSQSTLTPCHNCGRTFYPDRLAVHLRSCKTPQPKAKTVIQPSLPTAVAPMSEHISTPSSPHQPPTVECYICGRMFGTHSINIHERQCLKKWQTENDSLPTDMRTPPPVKNNKGKKSPPVPEPQRSTTDSQKEKERPQSGRRPPLFPCYLCGKLFAVTSIYIHEPQCLKKWKIENDKLPPNKRRPQPLKPDVKFTHSGKIDYEATNNANWQSHLSQLVPCKMCSRTFNPDRVDVHERSCKGN